MKKIITTLFGGMCVITITVMIIAGYPVSAEDIYLPYFNLPSKVESAEVTREEVRGESPFTEENPPWTKEDAEHARAAFEKF